MSDPNMDPVFIKVTSTMTATDRVRVWFAASRLGEPHLAVVGPQMKPNSLRSGYAEEQLRIEYQGRVAFWPRAPFEQQWPHAQTLLTRFFIDGVDDEAHATAECGAPPHEAEM
jgi:hypothetical protein